MGDFGLRVSDRFESSPLWRLSARALRLWVLLAMRAQHRAQNVILSDGQRVPVARGQWLTSARKLRKELGGGSLRSITADLAELQRVGALTLKPIPRYQSGNRGVTDPVTGGCYPNGNAECVMATLVTVEGVALAADPVTRLVTKEERQGEKATLSPLSQKETEEWDRAVRILAAEGR